MFRGTTDALLKTNDIVHGSHRTWVCPKVGGPVRWLFGQPPGLIWWTSSDLLHVRFRRKDCDSDAGASGLRGLERGLLRGEHLIGGDFAWHTCFLFGLDVKIP